MQTWDYLILDCKSVNGSWRAWMIDGEVLPNWETSKVTEIVKQIGRRGWELVTLGHSGEYFEYWVFKRPI